MNWSNLCSFDQLDTIGEGCNDLVILNQWYPLVSIDEIKPGIVHQTVLLETSVGFGVSINGVLTVWKAILNKFPTGSELFPDQITDQLPVKTDFGYLWTTLGSDPKELFSIDEVHEPDRRTLNVGTLGISTSAPRAVENFLDMGHFPFVHPETLGAEPHTEVVDYKVEIKNGEILATECKFFQPRASAVSTDGVIADYIYRVPHPYCVLLYKSGGYDSNRLDVVGLFMQPINQEKIKASMFFSYVDGVSTTAYLRRFGLGILSQDKPILENQIPKRLPLSSGEETPIRADRASIVYRRWLNDLGVTYGVIAPTVRSS